MGVANDNFGGACRGISRGGTACEFMTGLWLGDAGIARPSFGIRVPLLFRPPGIGGRSKGAGDAIVLGCWEAGRE